LREEEVIELRAVEPGLGQGMMEEWNNGKQGYSEHFLETMVAPKVNICFSPGDQYSTTPLLHQCSCFLQAEPINSDHVQKTRFYQIE
jgi:hypothetical protein